MLIVDVDVDVGLTTGGKTDSVFVPAAPLPLPVPVPVPVLVELSAVIVLCVTPPDPAPEPMGTPVGEFSPVMTVVVATSPTWMTSVHSACPFPSWHSTPTCSVFPPVGTSAVSETWNASSTSVTGFRVR